MLKNLRKKSKKKGFTLIELVIVLAVLAIIALIAIPNFTKVKENAVAQADEVNCDQVSNVTKLAISEGIIIPDPAGETFSFTINTATDAAARVVVVTAPTYGQDADGNNYVEADLQERLIDVERPQTQGMTGYTVVINADGRVVTTADAP